MYVHKLYVHLHGPKHNRKKMFVLLGLLGVLDYVPPVTPSTRSHCKRLLYIFTVIYWPFGLAVN